MANALPVLALEDSVLEVRVVAGRSVKVRGSLSYL